MRNTTFAFAVTLALFCAGASARAQEPSPDTAPPPVQAQETAKEPTKESAKEPAQVATPQPPQVATPPAASSRYTFNRVDDGFLRLDNNSGHVAFCSPHSVGWACQAVPEDRAALEKEIARLQDEVASLKQEVASLREPTPPRPPAELTKPNIAPPSAGTSEDAVKLREDIERARVAIENAWRRLVDMIVTFQKDMMRKG